MHILIAERSFSRKTGTILLMSSHVSKICIEVFSFTWSENLVWFSVRVEDQRWSRWKIFTVKCENDVSLHNETESGARTYRAYTWQSYPVSWAEKNFHFHTIGLDFIKMDDFLKFFARRPRASLKWKYALKFSIVSDTRWKIINLAFFQVLTVDGPSIQWHTNVQK